MLLDGKVIVISGVGPGMGQALARLAARDGAKLGLGARNQAFLDEVAGDIAAAGGEVVAQAADVTDKAACDALARATQARFGRIDGLVNSAYVHGAWSTTDCADAAEYAGIFDVNCAGALRMAQACLPGMRDAGGGAIVNISTMSTVSPFPGEGGYAAAKGGLNALTHHMAQDFGRYGIRVNLARMGWIGGKPVHDYIDGQVAAGRDRDAVVGEITARIPLGLIPPEEDCARAVLMLLSDYARVVTGASIDVNGGQYMAP